MAEPDLCALTGSFRLPDGRPLAFLDITVRLDGGPSLANSNFIGAEVKYRTDKNGDLILNLVQGFCYQFRVHSRPDAPFYFTVPELSSANLFDYLTPHAISVNFEESSYDLEVGETVSVELKVIYSDGTEQPFNSASLDATPGGIVEFDGLSMTGLQVGSTQLEISSIDSDTILTPVDLLEDPIVWLPDTALSLGAPITVSVS